MKKAKKIQLNSKLLPLALYACVLMALDLSFRYLYPTGPLAWDDWRPCLFTAGWTLMLTAAAALLPRRWSRIWMVGTVVFHALLVLTHCVMWNLFGDFFSLEDLLYAGEGARFFSLQYLQVRKAMAAALLLAVLGAIGAAWRMPKQTPWKARRIWFVPAVLGLTLVTGLHFASVTRQVEGTMSWDVSMQESSESSRKVLYTEFSNPNACMSMTGLYQYTFRNTAVTLDPFRMKDRAEAVAEINAWCESRVLPESGLEGSLEGKNLMMIMLESVDTFLITPQIMPNLYAMQRESVSFTDHYTPLYLSAGTFSTEFLTQTGLIPPSSGVSTAVYKEHAFPMSLANLFREKGYTANSFHGAGPAIYDRGAIHEHLGFTAYHSGADMGMEDYMQDSQMIRGFDQMVSDDPFFSFVITYSGHGPYDGSAPNISQPHLEKAKQAAAASGITGSDANMEELTYAIAHAMETDAFIGALRQALEESGHSEDTVLLFYADHYCKYLTDPAFVMEIKGVSERNLLCRTPLFFWGTGMEACQIDNAVSSVDIYPTVCSLFGLDADLRCAVGQDLFAGGDHLVLWPDYSWYDGSRYVDGAAAPTDAYEAETGAEARTRLNLAWDMVRCDYFK